MSFEYTVALIKPHAIREGHYYKIFEMYETQSGLDICDENVFYFTNETASRFYREHEGKDFFPRLIAATTEGATAALIISGEDAVQIVRKLNGPTDPAQAPEHTIRGRFRGAGGPCNTVHGSDSYEAALWEMSIVLPKHSLTYPSQYA